MNQRALTEIARDYCPRKKGWCFCVTACPLRTAAEVARAERVERELSHRWKA